MLDFAPRDSPQVMKILTIETSSARGSLALCDDTGLVEELVFPEGLVHGREVTVRIDELIRKHHLTPRDLDALAVSAGPGSYTGIRVGVTAAKSLAYALGCGVIPVSSLEVIATNSVGSGDSEGSSSIAVVLDARQGQLYRGVFRPVTRDGDPRVERTLEDGVEPLESLQSGTFPGLTGPVCLIGDGADLALKTLTSSSESSDLSRGPADWDLPRASHLAKIAARRWSDGEMLRDAAEIHALEPVYLRPSEAERRLRERAARENSGGQ